MVEPFYAVKCNPDPVIVKLLAALGCGFDCATKGEIDLVLNGLGLREKFVIKVYVGGLYLPAEGSDGARILSSTRLFYTDGADPAVTSLTLPNRWWRWIEHTVAIGLALKEEADAGGLASERQRIGDRILSTALAVDQTEAARVKDVRGRFVDDVRFRRDLATFGRRGR